MTEVGRSVSSLRLPRSVAERVVESAREHGLCWGRLRDSEGRMCLIGHAADVQGLVDWEAGLPHVGLVETLGRLGDLGQYDTGGRGWRSYHRSDRLVGNGASVDEWWSALVDGGYVIVEDD